MKDYLRYAGIIFLITMTFIFIIWVAKICSTQKYKLRNTEDNTIFFGVGDKGYNNGDTVWVNTRDSRIVSRNLMGVKCIKCIIISNSQPLKN